MQKALCVLFAFVLFSLSGCACGPVDPPELPAKENTSPDAGTTTNPGVSRIIVPNVVFARENTVSFSFASRDELFTMNKNGQINWWHKEANRLTTSGQVTQIFAVPGGGVLFIAASELALWRPLLKDVRPLTSNLGVVHALAVAPPRKDQTLTTMGIAISTTTRISYMLGTKPLVAIPTAIPVKFLAVSGDGLVAFAEKNVLKVARGKTGLALFSRVFPSITALAFSSDGTHLAIGLKKGGVTVIETKRWQTVAEIPLPYTVAHVRFNPSNGNEIAACGSNRYDVLNISHKSSVWDAEYFSDKEKTKPDPVVSVAFSPDGSKRSLVTASGRLLIWDYAHKK